MGRSKIHDEFTDLPISRQQKYQLRKRKAGLCILCGEVASSSFYCPKHAVAVRERARRNNGAVKRLTNCPSYIAEQYEETKAQIRQEAAGKATHPAAH